MHPPPCWQCADTPGISSSLPRSRCCAGPWSKRPHAAPPARAHHDSRFHRRSMLIAERSPAYSTVVLQHPQRTQDPSWQGLDHPTPAVTCPRHARTRRLNRVNFGSYLQHIHWRHAVWLSNAPPKREAIATLTPCWAVPGSVPPLCGRHVTSFENASINPSIIASDVISHKTTNARISECLRYTLCCAPTTCTWASGARRHSLCPRGRWQRGQRWWSRHGPTFPLRRCESGTRPRA